MVPQTLHQLENIMGVTIAIVVIGSLFALLTLRHAQNRRIRASVNGLRNTVKGEIQYLALGIENVRKKINAANEELKAGAADPFARAELICQTLSHIYLDAVTNADGLERISAQVRQAVISLKLARVVLGDFNDDQGSMANF